jgi:hypothetical protein
VFSFRDGTPAVDPPVDPPVSSVAAFVTGHSLNLQVPDMLAEIAREQGGSFTWREQGVAGGALEQRFNDPATESRTYMVDYTTEIPTGNWPVWISPPSVPRSPDVVNTSSTVEDVDFGFQLWIDYLRTHNNQQIWFYEVWHNTLGDAPGEFDTFSPTRNYPWLDRLQSDRGMWRGCVERARLNNPDMNINMIPGASVFQAVIRAGIAGEIPGYSGDLAYWQDLLFLDAIHMRNRAAYIMGLTWYACLYGQRADAATGNGYVGRDGDPVEDFQNGLGVDPATAYETLDWTPEANEAIKDIVWKVCREEPLTGLVAGFDPEHRAPGVDNPVTPGATLTIDSDGLNGFGTTQGQVWIGDRDTYAASGGTNGSLLRQCTVTGWDNDQVTVTVPTEAFFTPANALYSVGLPYAARAMGEDYRDRWIYVLDDQGAVIPYGNREGRQVEIDTPEGLSPRAQPANSYVNGLQPTFPWSSVEIRYFRNLIHQADGLTPQSGTDGFHYDVATTQARNVPNGAVFSIPVGVDITSPAATLYAGNYVVRWTGQAEVRIADGAWQSSGQFTVNLSTINGLFLEARNETGGTVATDFLTELTMIRYDEYPGATDAERIAAALADYDAGLAAMDERIFHPQFTSMLREINCRFWRTYNWQWETLYFEYAPMWSQHRVPGALTWGGAVPFEVEWALARAFDMDLAQNIPMGMDQDWITGFATLLRQEYGDVLAAGRRAYYLELGNETWNLSLPYLYPAHQALGRTAARDVYTRWALRPAGSQTFTVYDANGNVVPHGYSNGQELWFHSGVAPTGAEIDFSHAISNVTATTFDVPAFPTNSIDTWVNFMAIDTATLSAGFPTIQERHEGHGRATALMYGWLQGVLTAEQWASVVKAMPGQAGATDDMEARLLAYEAAVTANGLSIGLVDEALLANYYYTDWTQPTFAARAATVDTAGFVAGMTAMLVPMQAHNPSMGFSFYEGGNHDGGDTFDYAGIGWPFAITEHHVTAWDDWMSGILAAFPQVTRGAYYCDAGYLDPWTMVGYQGQDPKIPIHRYFVAHQGYIERA